MSFFAKGHAGHRHSVLYANRQATNIVWKGVKMLYRTVTIHTAPSLQYRNDREILLSAIEGQELKGAEGDFQ